MAFDIRGLGSGIILFSFAHEPCLSRVEIVVGVQHQGIGVGGTLYFFAHGSDTVVRVQYQRMGVGGIFESFARGLNLSGSEIVVGSRRHGIGVGGNL